MVFYRNPVVGVAVIVDKDGQVVLGRRAPNNYLEAHWCIPGGYVEWGEEVREAARREMTWQRLAIIL